MYIYIYTDILKLHFSFIVSAFQVEVNGTFTVIPRFVFHYKKFLTIKFITNSFASS